MPRTISDEEDAFLQGKRQIADFSEALYNDPNFSTDVKRLIKKKWPQMQIPDMDIMDRVDARFAEREKAEREEKEARQKEADEQKWRGEREATQKRYGFTDEAMTKLEKLMVDKGVGDYEVAASYMAQKEPKVSDGGFDTSRWHHEKASNWGEITKDPEAWGRNEIMQALRRDEERMRGQ